VSCEKIADRLSNSTLFDRHSEEVSFMSMDAGDDLLQRACRVHRIAWNMLGSPAEAEKATQQTLLIMMGFPDRAASGVSVYAVAIDVALLRLGPARRPMAESPDAYRARFDWSDLLDELIQRPDLAETIRMMLQRLDGMDRAAFVLREIEGFSIEETVDILRIPADEVRGRVHRALVLLTGLLGRKFDTLL
jgi:DNA-directed RNA polymerase specialized sigma24 family protein